MFRYGTVVPLVPPNKPVLGHNNFTNIYIINLNTIKINYFHTLKIFSNKIKL